MKQTLAACALLLMAILPVEAKKHTPQPAKPAHLSSTSRDQAASRTLPSPEGPAYTVTHATWFQPVVSPPVPESIRFAGKTQSFDRTDMYERLDRELTQMCYSHSSTLLMLKRANRVFPIIAPILKRNGVPEDLVYLAAIESTLNPRAVSAAKAAGIWQFMPSTAKQYGLEVNDYVDERYNLEKATAAAARYLKAAYAKYGNWESAMASYNGGQGRISGELTDQLAQSAFDLYLVEETTRYPYRVYAAKAIMEDPVKYGFNLLADQFYRPYECTEVEVTSTIDNLPQWAKEHGTTYAMLRELNPWLRAKSLPVSGGKSYTILVPKKGSMSKSAKKLRKNDLYNPNWVR